jgi:hypothetical protein
VPEIDANGFTLEGEKLTKFMQVISAVSGDGQRLSLGVYTLDPDAEAFVNGNKLFNGTQSSSVVLGQGNPGRQRASLSKSHS